MPNRILRPWVDSEAVNQLSDAAEVFFVRLIQCADDFGRFHGSPQLLKSYLFPLKDKRVADIARLIAECVKAGLIADYEVSGKRYIEIRKFNQRQRASVSRFPAPPPDSCQANDGHMSVRCQSDVSQMTAICGDDRREAIDDRRKEEIPPEKSKISVSGSGIYFDYEGDGKLHGITSERIKRWEAAYPGVDIQGELRRASAWLDANRKSRKKDIGRFLVNWLSRSDRQPNMPPEADADRKKRLGIVSGQKEYGDNERG